MDTAKTVITQTLHVYGIIDQMEQPTDTDIANNVPILNKLLRADHVDGAAQYLMSHIEVTLPTATPGQIYQFSVGTAQKSYLAQVDAVAVKSIMAGDIGPLVNRETRMAPWADVTRTLYPGTFTKWYPKRQIDGSVLITAWQPPARPCRALIEYGGRVGAITNPDGSDPVGLPPEGVQDVVMMLGRRIFSSYGRNPGAITALLADSEAIDKRWKDWAKGNQWLRMVRS
jgi:hypothetical protein